MRFLIIYFSGLNFFFLGLFKGILASVVLRRRRLTMVADIFPQTPTPTPPTIKNLTTALRLELKTKCSFKS